jgi:aminopeptidase
MRYRIPILALSCLAATCPIAAQDTAFAQLAHRIVTTSAGVKPGEVVVLEGGTHTIPFLEALAIEVQKAGGFANIFLGSERVEKSQYVDVPDRFLAQQPTFFAEWLKHIDVWIGLPDIADPASFYRDIPESRLAIASKAGNMINEMINAAPVRLVNVGYPTRQDAASYHVGFDAFQRMHWDAVNADYTRIAQTAAALKARLQGAKLVRITSPSGTDLRFTVGNRPIFVDEGIVTPEKAKSRVFLDRIASLPGGSAFFAPIETSVNGRVVVPRDDCKRKPLLGASYEFKNGKLATFTAQTGAECVREILNAYTGTKDMFGSVSIGLNPALRVIENDGDYRPGNAAGLVSLAIGQNDLLGGANKDVGGFGFPVTNATVMVDGVVVIRDGQLVLP